MAYVDLHIHSNKSDDAEFNIREIVEMCAEKKMKKVSITDHNSVKGVAEAIKLGQKSNIEVISGIEIDCVNNDETNFHLLGYMIDYKRKEFLEIEESIFKQEMNSAAEKIYQFKKYTGIPLDEKEIYDKSEGKIITGELIAEVVLTKEYAGKYQILKPYLKGGSRSDRPYVNLYWDFFAQGKPAYVKINFISLGDAISLVKSTGGVPVLAHPGQNLKNDFSQLDNIIGQGIEGIEAFSSYHSREVSEYFYKKALENNLVVTCGSDFHGKTKPDIKIGDCNLTIDESMILNV
jgi:predicted metal-dependent phosphoesterase TrpH